MPKEKNTLNFLATHRQEVVADWHAARLLNSKLSTDEFAKSLDMKGRTLRNWIKASSDPYQPKKLQVKKHVSKHCCPVTEAWLERQLQSADVPIIAIQNYIEKHDPAAFVNVTYKTKRNICDRLKTKVKNAIQGYHKLDYNTRAIYTRRVSSAPCRCKSICGEKCSNRLEIECLDSTCAVKPQFCRNRRIQREIIGPIEKRSWNGEYGIYATKRIEKGTFLIEYVGEVITKQELDARAQAHRDLYVVTVNKNTWIDAYSVGNDSRFVNHSCTPNAQLDELSVAGLIRIGIFAIEVIRRGEQVTFDYGVTYGFKKCLCESCQVLRNSCITEA
ncbi:unnamed protein product [Aphanomyces euteiches]|uniref:SET domain-containing protein n=1 Tax=Aphanomyces euteiches TaxID=100861 RepID=A0A6G0XSQ1_9STRA|nr:hypothetical protein Ae201684_001860 [Aphanomyces euteiches]KAH9089493.1 hypothetical protein Ae201684P_007663 [Aphanomyces euteiches]